MKRFTFILLVSHPITVLRKRYFFFYYIQDKQATMHLVFTRDGIVGLFIPKPSPQAVGAYFWCYFFFACRDEKCYCSHSQDDICEEIIVNQACYSILLVSSYIITVTYWIAQLNLLKIIILYQWSETGSENLYWSDWTNKELFVQIERNFFTGFVFCGCPEHGTK